MLFLVYIVHANIYPNAGIGNLSAVFLFPLLMYYFRLGASGAAISTVISQYVLFKNIIFLVYISWLDLAVLILEILYLRYIVTLLMIWYLNKRAVLLPPKMGALQFGNYIKSGK